MCALEFKPVKADRLFAAGLGYDKINWNDWSSVIDAFRDKMEGWYLNPVRTLRGNGDHSFAYLSLCCTLVDALSQYYYGSEESKQQLFVDFVDAHFPGFSAPLSASITFMFRGRPRSIGKFSEALYTGFRCGIVHEAHSKLYTGIWGTGVIVKEQMGLTKYANGDDCPTIIVDPGLFHARLEIVFSQYLSELRADPPASLVRRDNFKKKFLHSYGIDVGNEP